jgi:4-carboxymuconolactone decarboxylase
VSAERFPRLELEDLDDEQRRIVEPIVRYSGGIGGPFNSTLRSPEITELSFTFGEHLLFGTTLPRRLVEMAILMRARVSCSQLEWWAHESRAREAGLDAGVCDALRAGRRPDPMAEDEAALYELCAEVMLRPAVSDPTFARAREVFGERGIIELTYLVGFYGMISLVLKVAEVPAPDGSTPLEPMDAPFA